MKVMQKFLQKTTDGRPYVSFDEWQKTLPQDQYSEFLQAQKRQLAYRDEAISRGDMYIDSTSGDYIWKDQATADRGKTTDDVWYDYFERWRRECSIADASVLEKKDES
jgi:hypothetical protein